MSTKFMVGYFLRVPNLLFENFKKKKDLKGAIEKSIGWFLEYLFLEGFFKKWYHRMRSLGFTI